MIGHFPLRPLAIAVATVFLPGIFSGTAGANPVAPIVVSGNASFATQGKTLTVTNTPGAIINWQSFSIGQGETTRFQQQSASSAVLNRVVGQDPSSILGTLSSNGRVYLVNPNGIVFGAGARIDVQGLIASTLNISDADFKKGLLKFNKEGQAGSIQVNGYVNGGTGDIYIIAPNVSVGKEGVIKTEGGNVVLAAGEKIEIGSRNLNDMKFEVQAPANTAQVLGKISGGAVGVFAGTLKHSGDIRATALSGEGGKIVLKAKADLAVGAGSQAVAEGSKGGHVEIKSETGPITIEKGAVVSASATPAMTTAAPNVITGNGGTVSITAQQGNIVVEATAQIKATGQSGGQVMLQAKQGRTTLLGEIDVRGMQSTGTAATGAPMEAAAKGGTVKVLGDEVVLDEAASVDASGDSGGGIVLVGGDYQGKNTDVQNARHTWIGRDVVLRADALLSGNGGRAIVWADVSTAVHGLISAIGGINGGNGGFVETSGKGYLIVTRTPDVYSRRKGRGGEWLLDPNNIEILATTDANIGGSPIFVTTDDSAVISPTTIEAALNAGTSVTLITGSAGSNAQSGYIWIRSPITKSGGTDASLTLTAHQNIVLDTGIGIQSTAGKLDVTFIADRQGVGSGGIVIANGAAIVTNGGNVTLAGGGGSAVGTGAFTGPYTVNDGVLVRGTVAAAGGNITVVGATLVPGSSGVRLDGPGTLITSGTGFIHVNGNANSGVGTGISLSGSQGIANSGSGGVALTADASLTGIDIGTIAATAISSGGVISLTADRISFNNGLISTPGQTISIQPFAFSTPIFVGQASGSGLVISNAALQNLQGGTLTLGSALQTGDITFRGAVVKGSNAGFTGVGGLATLAVQQNGNGAGKVSIDYFSTNVGDGLINASSAEIPGIDLGQVSGNLVISAGTGGIQVVRSSPSIAPWQVNVAGAVTLDTKGAIGAQPFSGTNTPDLNNERSLGFGPDAPFGPSLITIGQTNAPSDVVIGAGQANLGKITIAGVTGASQATSSGLQVTSGTSINFTDDVNVGAGRVWVLADLQNGGHAINLAAGKTITTTSSGHLYDASGSASGVVPVAFKAGAINLAGTVNVGVDGDVALAPTQSPSSIYVGQAAGSGFRLNQATLNALNVTRSGSGSNGGHIFIGDGVTNINISGGVFSNAPATNGAITLGTGADAVLLPTLSTSAGVAFTTTSTIDSDGGTSGNSFTARGVFLAAGNAIGSASGAGGLRIAGNAIRVRSSGGQDVTITETGAGNVILRRLTTGGAGNISFTKTAGDINIAPSFTAGDQISTSGNVTITGNNIAVQDTSVFAGGTMDINGSGTLSVAAVNNSGAGAFDPGASIYSFGNQTIAVNGITLTGGATGTNRGALIRSDGGQAITVGAGGITLNGGGGVDNWASIGQWGVAGQAITVTGGGSITLTGGSGTNAYATVDNHGGSQQIGFIAGGSINLQGGASSGGGSEALIFNTGALVTSQIINFTGGPGSISATGGTVGNTNSAGIIVDNGNQSILGTPNIVLTGGASGGGGIDFGNSAAIFVDGGSGSQDVVAGTIQLTGGAGGNFNVAAIGTGASGITQTVSSTGNITLQGGAGIDALALIGGFVSDASSTVNVGGVLSLTGGSGATAVYGAHALVGAVNGNANVNINAQGAITLNRGAVGDALIGSIVSGAGSVTVKAGLGGGGGIALNDGKVHTAGAAILEAAGVGGAITQLAGGSVNAASLAAKSSAGTSLIGANNVASFAYESTGSGNVAFNNGGALVLGAISQTGGDLSIATGGAITQSAAMVLSGGASFNTGNSDLTLTHVGNSVTGTGLLQFTNTHNTTFSANSALRLGPSTVAGNLGITAGPGGTGVMSVSGMVTAAGNVTLVAQQPGTGTVVVNGGASVTSTAGNVNYVGDHMALTGTTVAASAGSRVMLTPFTAGTAIDIGGADGAATLGLASTELGSITASVLQIGSAAAGDITISNLATLPANTLSLETGAGIGTSGSGIVTVNNLAVRAVNSVNLTLPQVVGTLAGEVTGAGQSLNIHTNTNSTVGTVDGLNGARTNNGDINLSARGANNNLTIADTAAAIDIDAGTGAAVLSNFNPGGTATLAINGQVRGGRIGYLSDHITIGAGSTSLSTAASGVGGGIALGPQASSTVATTLTNSGSGVGVITQAMLDTLTVSNGGGLSLGGAQGDVNVSGNVALSGAQISGQTTLYTRAGNIHVNADLSVPNALGFQTTPVTPTGSVTGAGRISAGGAMTVIAGEGVSLTNAANSVGGATFTNATSGDISFANASALPIFLFSNAAAGGTVTLNNTGAVTLSSNSSTSNGAVSITGASIQLNAQLNAGAGAVSLTTTSGTISQLAGAGQAITAGALTLDTSAVGSIGSAVINAQAPGGALTVAAGSKVAGNLTLNAGARDVSFGGAVEVAGTATINTTGTQSGTTNLRQPGGIVATQVSGNAITAGGAGTTLSLDQALFDQATGGTVNINLTGGVYAAGNQQSASAISLASTANSISGPLTIRTTDPLLASDNSRSYSLVQSGAINFASKALNILGTGVNDVALTDATNLAIGSVAFNNTRNSAFTSRTAAASMGLSGNVSGTLDVTALSLAGAGGNIAVNGALTTGGNTTLTTDVGRPLIISSPITASAGNINLVTDVITGISANVTANAGDILVRPFTTSRPTQIEATPTVGYLGLSPADLSRLFVASPSNSLRLGNPAGSGQFQLNTAITSANVNARNVVFGGNSFTGGGSVNFSGAGGGQNANLTFNTGGGAILLGGDLNVGAGVLDLGTGNVTFSGPNRTLTSTNAGTGLLSAGTWTLSGVGGPQVNVIANASLNTVTLSAGTNYTLSIQRPTTINTLNWNAGTVGGVGGANGESLTINNTLNWSGGFAFNLPVLNIAAPATANVSGTIGGDNGITVNNAGTWNHNAAVFSMGDGTTIFNNQATGVFNMVGTGSITSADQFINAGQIFKTGAGTGTISAGDGANTFTGTGSVSAQAGTLTLSSFGGTYSGAVSAASGATVQYAAATTRTFDAASSLSGPGVISFAAGTNTIAGTVSNSDITVASGVTASFTGAGIVANNVSVAGAATFANTGNNSFGNLTVTGGTTTISRATDVGALTWSGGTLAGAAQLRLTGTGNWTDTANTTLTGNLRITDGATLNASGATDQRKRFGAGTLTIDTLGTFNWTQGHIDIVGAGSVVNNGLFLVADGGTSLNFGDRFTGTGSLTFSNNATGIIRKTGAGISALGSLGVVGGTPNFINLTNNGSIDVQGGTLQFNIGYNGAAGGGTVTNNGATTIAGGASIEFGGTATHSAASSFSGAGGYTVSRGGNVTFNGNYGLTGDITVTNGGSGTATAVFSPTGPISAANVTVSGGTATFTGALSAGSFSVTGGAATLNAAATLGNLNVTGGILGGSGTLDVTNMTWGSHLVGNRVTNVSGTLSINAGAALSTGSINSNGTATFATAYFGVPLSDGAVFNNFGTLNINTNAEFWQGTAVGTPFSGAFSTTFYSFSGTGARFVNQPGGVLNRNPFVNGSIFYGLAVDNLGTINIDSGFLGLRAGGNLAGTINRTGGGLFGLYLESGAFDLAGSLGANALVAATGGSVNMAAPLALGGGATLAIRGATANLNAGAALSGTGGLSVETGTLNVNGAVPVSNLALSGGLLQGAGSLSVANWTRSGGTFNMSGSADLTRAAGDFSLDQQYSATTLALRAPTGRIIDGFNGYEVVADNLTLVAGNGVGIGGPFPTPELDLLARTNSGTTGVINLTAQAGTGGVFLTPSDHIDVQSLTVTGAGNASIRTTDVAGRFAKLGDVTLAAGNLSVIAGNTITQNVGTTLNINGGATFDTSAASTLGSVSLSAANPVGDLTIAAGSKIAGTLDLNAGARNVIFGSTVDVGISGGAITAASQSGGLRLAGSGNAATATATTITAGGSANTFDLTQALIDSATAANITVNLASTGVTAGNAQAAAAITVANAGNSISGPVTINTVNPNLSTSGVVDYNLVQSAALNFGNKNITFIGGSSLGDVTLTNTGNTVGGTGVFRFSGTRTTQFTATGLVRVGDSSTSGSTTIRSLGEANELRLNGVYTSTAAAPGNTFALVADGSVVLGRDVAAGVATTQPLNVLINPNNDAAGTGAAQLRAGTSINTQGGNLTVAGGANPLLAPQPAVGNSTYDDGVSLAGTTIATGAGNITLSGRGLASNSNNDGVSITASSSVTSTSGNVSITGFGGAAAGSTNRGVVIQDSAVATASGSVSISGTGGNGTFDNYGVHITGATAAVTSATGAITISGSRGTVSAENNDAVRISSSASIVTGGAGGIAITGTGGGAGGTFDADGVYISGLVNSTGSGAISITGAGAGTQNSNSGIYISGTVQSASGGITLTGTGSGGTFSNRGVRVDTGGRVESATGALVINGTRGAGNGADNEGVRIDTGALIVSGATSGAAITMNGGGAAPSATTDNEGVNIHGTVRATAGGRIDITGTGAGTTSWNVGTYIDGVVESTATTGGGAINIIGTGSNGTDNNHGVRLSSGGRLQSGSGAISIDGTRGNASGFNNSAVHVSSSAAIIANGAGGISVHGAGAAGSTDTDNDGISIYGSITTNAGGAILLDGTAGGAGSGSPGVYIAGAVSSTAATGGGAITILGAGANGSFRNRGVNVDGGRVSTVSGNINITGTRGDGSAENRGVQIGSSISIGVVESTGSGNIAITGQGATAIATDDNDGVAIFDTVRATGSGGISITGSGAGSGLNNNGVFVSGRVQAAGGAVSVIGTAGAGGAAILLAGPASEVSSVGANGVNGTAVLAATAGQAGGAVNLSGLNGAVVIEGTVKSVGGSGGAGFNAVASGSAGGTGAKGGDSGAIAIASLNGAVSLAGSSVIEAIAGKGGNGGAGAAGAHGLAAASAAIPATNGASGGSGGAGGTGGSTGSVQISAATTLDMGATIQVTAGTGGDGGSGGIGGNGGDGLAFANGGNGGNGGAGGVGGAGGDASQVSLSTTAATGGNVNLSGQVNVWAGNGAVGGHGGNGGEGGGSAGWVAVGPPPVPRRAGDGGRGGDSPFGGDGGSLDASGALLISSGNGGVQIGGGLWVSGGVSGGAQGAGIGGAAGKGGLALDPNPNPLGTQHRASDGVAGSGGNFVGSNQFGAVTLVRIEAVNGAVGDAGGSGIIRAPDLLVKARNGISLDNPSNQVSRADIANSAAGNIVFSSADFLELVDFDSNGFVLTNAQGSAAITGAGLAVAGNISLQNGAGASDLTLTATAFDIQIHASTIDAGTVTTNGRTVVDGAVAINAPLTVNGALDITTIDAFSAHSVSAGDFYNASVNAVIGGEVISAGSIDNIGHLSALGNISATGGISNGFGNMSAGGNVSAGTGSITNAGGSIDAGGNIGAGDAIANTGALSAGGNLGAGGKLTNAGTITLSGGIISADSIEWTGGTITASSIELANGGGISNGVTLNSSLNLNGGTIDFAAANLGGSGSVVLGAAASMRVTGSTALNNTGGLINNGTIAIDADSADASLTVNGDFTNNTTLTLTSSNSGGNASLTVSGGSFFNSGIIDVQAGAGGTRTIQAGAFELQDAGRIQGDGVLDISAPFSWTGGSGVIASGVEVRLNQGGSMIGSQGVIDGVLRNANGTLQLVNATVSGTGRLANDATLEFGGAGSIVDVPIEGTGNLNVLGGATFNGLVQQSGTVHVASGVSGVFSAGVQAGTLDLAGAADLGAPSSAGTLVINGGLVNGGVLTVDTLNWNGGAIDSTVTVNAGGTVAGTVNLTGSLTLAGGTLAMNDVAFSGGGTIHNNADIATNGTSNALAVPLDGNGTVTVNTLTNFSAPVTGALTFFVGGQASFGAVLEAAATFITSGGVTASSTADIGTLGLQGGSFGAAGTLTLQNSLNWTGGVLSAPQITLANGGAFSGTGLTLGGPLSVTGGLLVNAPGSSLTVTDVIALSGGASFFNQGSVTLNSGAAQPVQGTAAERFINAGTLVKGGAGAAEIVPSFSNAGTVTLANGSLTLRDGSGTDGGSFNAAPGTTLKFAGNRLLDPNSAVNAAGATVEFDPLAGKTVRLEGALNAGTVNVKSGTVSAATTTSFITAGDYTQTGGVLQGSGGNVRTTNSFNFPGGSVSGTFGSIDVTHGTGNLPIGSLNAINAVTLNAVNGALVDANGAGININAPSVTLSAANGISLDTQTASLAASNLGGALSLRNSGAVVVSGISQGGGGAVTLSNTGDLTLSNLQAGASSVTVNVTGGSLLQGAGGPAITSTGPIAVNAGGIGTPGGRLMVDGTFTLFSAGNINAGKVGDAQISGANLQVGAGGSLDFLTTGKLDVVGDLNLGGGVTLQAQGGTLTIGTASGAALITGQNVSLTGGGVAVTNGSAVPEVVSGVQASGVLAINTGGGNLDVTGGNVQGAKSKLVSAGNASITVGGLLRITGGSGQDAGAFIDPTSAGQNLSVSAAGGLVLQGGSGGNAFAALGGNGNVDFSGTPSVDLRAGTGTLANAAIAAYGGQWVNLSAICVGCTVLPTNPLVFGGGGITGVLATGTYSGFIPAPPSPVAPPPPVPPELFTNQPKPEPVVGEPPRPREKGEVVVEDDGC